MMHIISHDSISDFSNRMDTFVHLYCIMENCFETVLVLIFLNKFVNLLIARVFVDSQV